MLRSSPRLGLAWVLLLAVPVALADRPLLGPGAGTAGPRLATFERLKYLIGGFVAIMYTSIY